VDPPLKTWIASKPDVVAIEYHTPFPYPGDPFYLYNLEEQDARRAYYGVPGVPRIHMDGPDRPSQNNPAAYEALYAAHKAIPSVTDLSTDVAYDVVSRAGSISVTIDVAAPPPSGDWRLRVALTQSDIHFEAPNGIDVHHHIFRRFVGDAGGTPIVFSGPYPSTVQVMLPFTVDVEWPDDDVQLVVMLQNDADKRIDQAIATSLPLPLDMNGALDAPPVDLLGPVHPNPFNPRTVVSMHLGQAGPVLLLVYAANGALVRTLIRGSLPSGTHRIVWDGTDDAGVELGSGVYWIRLEGPSASLSARRAVLLK
jgi:hypothetical protein